MNSYQPDYSIRYGNKYDADLDVKEIAKRVRADIKAAVKDGTLPYLKASVRISRFSGGSSISVEVKSAGFQVMNPDFVKSEDPYGPNGTAYRYTETAQLVLKDLEAMVEAYNFDGSDSMVDYFHVNFYSHASFCHDLERAERQAIMAEVEAERAAAEAATVTVDLSRPQACWNF